MNYRALMAIMAAALLLAACIAPPQDIQTFPTKVPENPNYATVRPVVKSTPIAVQEWENEPTPTKTISVKPTASDRVLQQIVPIEASVYDLFVDGQYLDIKHVEWEPDSLAVRYAVGKHCLDEPKDWLWWRYDLRTNSKQVLPPPRTAVSEALRKKLKLRSTLAANECDGTSYLSESPSRTRFVYAPGDVKIDGDYKVPDFKLWYSRIDGTRQILLEDVDEAMDVAWSPLEDWILIITDVPDVPMVDVAKVDGSFTAPLSSLVEALPTRRWLMPRFSPDGKKIAYLGSSGYTPEEYGTWVVDIGSWKAVQVSQHAGPVQWSQDSRSLYVIDQKSTYQAELEGRFNETFDLDLYRVDVSSSPPQERIVASNLPWRSTGISGNDSFWALSPNGRAIAYAGIDANGMFGIVQFSADQ